MTPHALAQARARCLVRMVGLVAELPETPPDELLLIADWLDELVRECGDREWDAVTSRLLAALLRRRVDRLVEAEACT